MKKIVYIKYIASNMCFSEFDILNQTISGVLNNELVRKS